MMLLHISIFLFQVALLAAAIFLPQSWVCWTVLQLSLLPLFVLNTIDSEEGSTFCWNLPLFLSSLLLGIGYWFGLPATDAFTHQAGIAFVCVGVGGMTGWFPVSTISHFRKRNDRLAYLLSLGLLPICMAALFFRRTVAEFFRDEQDLALLAVISLFSLAVCGLRLLGPLQIDQRIRYSIFTILGNASIATVLYGWERLHPDNLWHQTSNIPDATALFAAVLLVESAGVLLMTVSAQKVVRNFERDVDELDFVERIVASRWLGKLFLAGNLTVAGFPAMPGSLWRFALIAALVLPHHRSNVTGLAEPHTAFITLAIVYLLTTIIVMLGQCRMVKLYLEQSAAKSSSPETAQSCAAQ